jgi:Tol biopolymer transport system component
MQINSLETQPQLVKSHNRSMGCWVLALAWLGLMILCGKVTLDFGKNLIGIGGNLEPVWSPDGQQIAFVSNSALNPAIHVMNTDGSGERRLTDSAGESPAWSPDGQRIAFISNNDVYIVNADGSELTLLYNAPSMLNATPRWSPDGELIAFMSGPTFFDNAIYIINVDSNEKTRLTDSPITHVLDFRWSPDGSQIAFDCWCEPPEVHMYVMNADGRELTKLGNNQSESPSWSPDSKRVVFDSGSAGSTDIYTINADGSDLTRLTNGGRYFAPLWSPDGTQITFFSASTGKNVYIMTANGGGERPLVSAKDTGHIASFSWSPDSQQIAFVHGHDIYIANSDGSGQKRLTGSLLKDIFFPCSFIVLLLIVLVGTVKFLLDRRRKEADIDEEQPKS